MPEPIKSPDKIEIRICAIIPTYNNAGTIASVISDTNKYLQDIIAVNDGSTDNTKNILQSLITSNSKIIIINFDKNTGKGSALRAGFEKALEFGFTHAISLDADGQHFAEDIPAFLEKIAQDPEALWIGDRILRAQETGEPARSAAGRRFGSFWYKFITGIDIRDTQCGFRAYPLASVRPLKCTGERYEFEQEVLVKAAWSGMTVKPVQVHLFYAPKGRAVSHFRPVRDFLRIFKVNSKAVLIKILAPFLIVDMPGATWRQKFVALFKHELQRNTSPRQAAFSLTLGVFVGMLPIPFLQMLLLLVLSFFMRINRPLAFLGVNVSSLPFLPVLIPLAIATGRLVVPASWTAAFSHFHYRYLVKWGVDWFFGSIILAFVFAGICWAVSYPFFLRLKKRAAQKKNVGD
jgi:glycosyltransferase involved in cell wall biosynthesis